MSKVNWKYEIGQVIKDEKRDMIIIDRKIRVRKSFNSKRNKYCNKNEEWYKYHCNIDGNEDWIYVGWLNSGQRCNVCNNRKAMLGINTIWDTDRYLVTDYGLDEEFAKTHTVGVGEKGKFICKDCGNIKLCRPNNVRYNKSIGCSCNDNFSYPEKFIRSMLEQLNIDFEFQLTKNNFKWIGDYRYDFYIPSLNLILEIHGIQHGKFITKGELTIVKKERVSFNKKNKRDEIKNDIDKCWIAYNNGVGKYIQLDCSNSDLGYIKNIILNSELNNIFDLNNIDWNKCEEFALKNIVKEVCDYWCEHKEINKEEITTKDVARIFNIDRTTIIRYLKKGAKLGWCDYNPKKEKGGGSKRVICIELNRTFKSISEAERELNISLSHISMVFKGKRKTCGGYHWKEVIE